MRRCPHCHGANPSAALFCQHCGQGLPPLKKPPFWILSDWWAPPALKAALLPLLLLACFRLSFGSWLNGGFQRDESKFLSFHLLHGALFGWGLAWARRERSAGEILRWVLTGLLGGLLAEAGEYWYTYQHVMGGLSFKILDWYNVQGAALFPYRFLQALRLAGVAVPLGLGWIWAQKPRLAPQVLALLALVLALYLRAFVVGYALSWAGLASLSPLSWAMLGLYLLSPLLLLYAGGPRPEAGQEKGPGA